MHLVEGCVKIKCEKVLHITAGGEPTLPEGGESNADYLTFHIFGLVFTIKVKSENRHPGR